jgi:glutamate-ammonia-ligase adenylyltransferase
LNSDAILTGHVLDLFEHSPYFAEQIIRTPDLIEELQRMLQHPGEELRSQPFDDVSELRRGFRRHMFRIQAESICLATPIFNTLARTSALADLAVASAYCIALNQVAATRPPASAGYEPKDQMMVIALGRLGMREFDLGSDADLVFVLKDADASEHLFWTRVAEKLIETLTAYTGEGNIFAVDTRLRPNGREGALVQLERTYMDYFERAAEAWEGITYMKSLGISGDIEHATRFLTELQVVDWRRYGQSGRSQKELRRMRARLEKEQGAENPLKAGPGGYFDIDFALMYLRLRGAGIFYKVLNTPERIDVIEKMGHLDHAEAVFLNDAATFYRAVDHGLRVSTGHTEGSLPHAPAQLQTLAGLVTRWTPEHLHDQELPVELSQIQDRTRAFFDRLFGA